MVGIGNRARGDDAVGPEVVRVLREMRLPIRSVIREGDLTDLPLQWDRKTPVIIVDACRTGAAAGTVTLLDPGQLDSATAVSSHMLGLAQALELAGNLGRLPDVLRIVGIEVATVDYGPMSGELQQRLPEIAQFVAELAGSVGVEP